MITLWEQEHSTKKPYMILTKLVSAENTRKVLVPTALSGFVGINALTLLNRGGQDRAASPGWGVPAPSKSLIGDLGHKRLTTFATRS